MAEVIHTQVFSGFSSEDYNKEVLYDVELITRDLKNHFYTRRGERVMNPEFGTIIWDMLFEPFTENVRNLVREDVIRVIESEPRVELQNVEVATTSRSITVRMEIRYLPFNSIGTLDLEFDQRALAATQGVIQ